MAQSHDNQDFPTGIFEQLKQLEARAEKMTEDGTNTITAGKPGESVIAERRVVGFGLVRRLPEDPLCLRISIGQFAGEVAEGSYLTFRGDPSTVRRALLAALGALAMAGPL